jgi:Prenyltransferase and squalene oxidase repeat
MKKLIRFLALPAALGAGVLGTNLLFADEKPLKPPPTSTLPILPDEPVKPRLPGLGGDRAPGANPMGDSKPDNKVEPVKIGDVIVKTDTAVKPKELSAAVKKGLEFLVKSQQEDGGWNQGGGWRTGVDGGGGRIEGKKVEDPSDIGNSCFALLALLRAGNTATDGPYKENVKKGLAFVIGKVEKADKDSLYVTDVKGTQLQSKIGPYIDTFLVNLVLAEFRGKSGDQEKKLIAALEKTMTKIVRHQTADGGFAGNAAWASTLSLGIANKSLARAKERGATVDETVLKRALAQSTGAATGTAPVAVPPAAGFGGAGGVGGGVPGAAMPKAGAASDAGIKLYAQGQGAGNSQDIINGLRLDAEKAKKVIADGKAPKAEKDKAEKTVEEFKKADDANDKLQTELAKNARDDKFVAGFGNNGGEEFLSFMNISEALILKGGKDWDDWDTKMAKGMEKAQDKDGSWQGHHCITGKTFCTAGALLVLMADRTPFPLEVIKAAKEKKEEKKPEEKKPEEKK